jgi:hypothetical protein
MAVVAGPPPSRRPPPGAKRFYDGWGAAAARVLRAVGGGIARSSVLVWGFIRARGQAAHADFQRRKKHVRYRFYAFGGYAAIAAGTLVFQLYSPNPIGAHVRLERIEFPRSATAVLIRNDSEYPWNNVRVVLNGTWLYERPTVEARDNVIVRVDRFAVVDKQTGKPSFPPPDTAARHLRIDCDRGSFESELK